MGRITTLLLLPALLPSALWALGSECGPQLALPTELTRITPVAFREQWTQSPWRDLGRLAPEWEEHLERSLVRERARRHVGLLLVSSLRGVPERAGVEVVADIAGFSRGEPAGSSGAAGFFNGSLLAFRLPAGAPSDDRRSRLAAEFQPFLESLRGAPGLLVVDDVGELPREIAVDLLRVLSDTLAQADAFSSHLTVLALVAPVGSSSTGNAEPVGRWSPPRPYDRVLHFLGDDARRSGALSGFAAALSTEGIWQRQR